MEITLKSCDEIIDKNSEYTKRLGFNITVKKLSLMYWIPKIPYIRT